MLDRLAQSEEQTVWYSLWDKVCGEDNLFQASLEVILNRGSAGVDGQTTTQFKIEWREQIARLQQELREDLYRPQPARRVWIDKAGSPEKRPLGIPAVRDRVVQAAVRHVLEPIFERDFAEQSYGFRPGRGCLGALARVEELLEDGCTWVVDADLKSYFDTIPHDRLLERVSARVADGRVLALLRAFLEAGVMEGGKGWKPTERGTPQGGVISPLLANLYLNPLDHQMAAAGYEMVRYADDLVIVCRTEATAQAALAELAGWVEEAGLKLHPVKTRIVNAAEKGGFDFLGYHFERYQEGTGKKWFGKKAQAKLRASLRAKTSRLRSGSMSEIIADINPTLRGWHAYYRYSLPSALVSVNGWVRRRLRSIQRWRLGRKGGSRGRENPELPNAWFADQGLFCL
jgi:RNA-directed DNA polymerase